MKINIQLRLTIENKQRTQLKNFILSPYNLSQTTKKNTHQNNDKC
jgi:hypothetical protein